MIATNASYLHKHLTKNCVDVEGCRLKSNIVCYGKLISSQKRHRSTSVVVHWGHSGYES
jgi:hypothetical protein